LIVRRPVSGRPDAPAISLSTSSCIFPRIGKYIQRRFIVTNPFNAVGQATLHFVEIRNRRPGFPKGDEQASGQRGSGSARLTADPGHIAL